MSSDSSPSLEQMRSHRSILLSSHDIVDQDKNPESIHGTFSHLLQRSRNAIFKQKIRCDGRLTLSGRVESTENDVHDRSLSTAPWGGGDHNLCHVTDGCECDAAVTEGKGMFPICSSPLHCHVPLGKLKNCCTFSTLGMQRQEWERWWFIWKSFCAYFGSISELLPSGLATNRRSSNVCSGRVERRLK